ncbi:MAG: hypothetical protein LBR26_16250 [Prevotella sp.]|jgi:hypothetical protein|nr:hypothetical protein [Prevotella sp.]
MEKKTSQYPEWVTSHRKPGTEIRKFKDRYYVYAVKGFYDKEKKKSRKKTVGFPGTVSESEGFVEAKTKRVPRSYKSVDVKNISTRGIRTWRIYMFLFRYNRTVENVFSPAAGMDACSVVLPVTAYFSVKEYGLLLQEKLSRRRTGCIGNSLVGEPHAQRYWRKQNPHDGLHEQTIRK